MTDPSQYFRGRTVQEQMNEVIGYVDVRSAEVATDAIASDVAQVHQDMLDADADASAAAASAAAAAGTLANAVKKTGEASQSIAGDIAVAGDLTGGTVTVPTPVNNTDAASKKYVDDQDALDVHLTGAQSVGGVKTFSDSPVVPTETTGTFSTNAANSTKVKNEINNLTVMLTGSQTKSGILTMTSVDPIRVKQSNVSWAGPTATFYLDRLIYGVDMDDKKTVEFYATHDASGQNNAQMVCTAYADDGNGNYTVPKRALINLQVRSSDGKCRLILQTPSGQNITIQDWVA